MKPENLSDVLEYALAVFAAILATTATTAIIASIVLVFGV